MKRDSWGVLALLVIVAICAYLWYRTSDFALALVVLTVVFFVIWLVDRIAFAGRRRAAAAKADEAPHEPVLVDYARSFFPVILAVLVFRSFLLEPFRIPSGSMMPTLRVGDFVLVNKFSYGLRLPVTNSKILDTGEPKRGDIAVFRYPLNPKEDFIKRIIGLPGDTVIVQGEHVTVNGKPIPEQLIGDYHGTDKTSIEMEENPAMAPVRVYRNELGGVRFDTLHFGYAESYNCIGGGGTLLPAGGCEWKVPAGEYFAMGDNRDDSMDSRFWGFVPERNLVGRAFFIWFSIAGWPDSNWHRIGTVLR